MDPLEELIFGGDLPAPPKAAEAQAPGPAPDDDAFLADFFRAPAPKALVPKAAAPVRPPAAAPTDEDDEDAFLRGAFAHMHVAPAPAPAPKPAPAPPPAKPKVPPAPRERKPAGPRPTTRIVDDLPARKPAPEPVSAPAPPLPVAPAPAPAVDAPPVTTGLGAALREAIAEPEPESEPALVPRASGDALYKLLVDMDAFRAGEAEEQQLWDAMHATVDKLRATRGVIRRLEERIVGQPEFVPFSGPLQNVDRLVDALADAAALLRDKNLKRTANTEQLVRRAAAVSMGLGAVRPEDVAGDGDHYMLRFDNGALQPYDTTETLNLDEFDIM